MIRMSGMLAKGSAFAQTRIEGGKEVPGATPVVWVLVLVLVLVLVSVPVIKEWNERNLS